MRCEAEEATSPPGTCSLRSAARYARQRPSGEADRDFTRMGLTVHRVDKLAIRLGIFHLIEQEFHRVHRIHGRENPAQDPDPLEVGIGNQELFLTGGALVDVEAGEDPLLEELAVKHDLAIACAFELLENYFVHARAGVDQGRRDDRQRAAFLDLAGRTEETLRLMERVRINTSPQDLFPTPKSHI